VFGRSPEQLLISSPQRKIGSNEGKRSAPQAKPLNAAAAAFVPNTSFHPGTGSSGSLKMHRSYATACSTAAVSSGSTKKGVRVNESKNKVVGVDNSVKERPIHLRR
jgi:hypothetical protein